MGQSESVQSNGFAGSKRKYRPDFQKNESLNHLSLMFHLWLPLQPRFIIMWHYQITSPNPASRYIQVVFKASVNTETTEVRLPKWRPGRYELGNFAKNVRDFSMW